MVLQRVRVRHYRSIEDTGWVDLSEDIITLLGKNESGKSSFLQAISTLSHDEPIEDKDLNLNDRPNKNSFKVVESDFVPQFSSEKFKLSNTTLRITKYSDGLREVVGPSEEHLIPIDSVKKKSARSADSAVDQLNKYRSDGNNTFQNIFDNQVKQHLNNIRSHATDNDREWLISQAELVVEGLEKLSQSVETKNLDIVEDILKEFQHIEMMLEKTKNFQVENLLPPFIYHDEFDRLQDSAPVNSLDRSEYRTFRNLLNLADINHSQFAQNDKFDRARLLNSAETEIAGDVNEIWQQKSIDIDIDYSDNEFLVQIQDQGINGENDTSNRTLIRPSNRSKGFQWFLSFYINLSAETTGNDSNKILLLDDPAVFLHPEGKKNWLSAIEGMTDSAQIIYSSHSPFLIRKEHPERIRIVEDDPDEGTKINSNISESNETSLEPLRNALGIGLGDSPFASKRQILVEGVSDYYYLSAVNNFLSANGTDILNWEEVAVMPSNGGNNMVRAAKWVASEEFSYALLLDNDQKGKDIESEIMSQHQEIDENRILLLYLEDDKQNFHIEIEDLFDTEFFIDCLNSAYLREGPNDFEPIDVTIDGDPASVYLDDVEYNNRKITSKLNDLFSKRGWGDLDKILVANEVRDRLNNDEAEESAVEAFKPILGDLRSLT